jgi:hypothetical protein
MRSSRNSCSKLSSPFGSELGIGAQGVDAKVDQPSDLGKMRTFMPAHLLRLTFSVGCDQLRDKC